MRTALGASRVRIIHQLLTESLALASAGAILGLLFAYFALPLLTALAPAGIPRLDEITIDARVFTFAAFVAILTGLVFGTLPALHSSRLDIWNSLKAGSNKGATASRQTQRFRSVLAAAEIAASLTLLVGAGLVMRSFSHLVQVDPGFDSRNVLVVRAFPDERAYADSAKRLAYFRALFERLKALPSVESVGATTGLPLSEFNNAPSRPYWPEGEQRPGASGPMASLKMTTANYFKTMGISLLAGRDFSEFDDSDAPPVIVINTAIAGRVWPGENAVGKRLIIDYGVRGIYPHEVIGVVESSRVDGLRKEAPPEIFIAETQVPYAQMNIVLRTSADPMLIAKAAQREVLELDPAQPVHSMTTMEQLVSRSVAQERFSLVLIVALAVLALVLALSGVYGLMS